MINDDKLMTVTEVADAMRVSKMTVYRLFREGKLGGFRAGAKLIRIPESGVAAYMASPEA